MLLLQPATATTTGTTKKQKRRKNRKKLYQICKWRILCRGGKGESVTEIKHHKNNTQKVEAEGGEGERNGVAAVGESGKRQKNRHAEKLKQKLTCDKARHLAAI